MGTKIHLTEDQYKIIKDLFDQKHGTRYICKQLGVGRWIIQNAYKKLGIYNIGRKTPRGKIPPFRQCTICLQTFDINNFRKRIGKRDRIFHEAYCTDCENELGYIRREPKHVKEKLIQEIQNSNGTFHVNIAIKRAQEKRDREIRNDIRTIVSNGISRCLRKNGSGKNGDSSFDFLPYTPEELRINIESKFEPWMNWDNHGMYIKEKWDPEDSSTWKWQLDHFHPSSEFMYTSMDDSAFIECWSLSNLRPLSAMQNVIEGVRRVRHNKQQIFDVNSSI